MSSANVSSRLKKALDEKQMSRDALARALDVHPSTVDRWLLGDRVPTYQMAERIAIIVGISPGELIFGEKPRAT